MDNSPTTGSVTTTIAEKEKLAKVSLAYNCKKWAKFLATYAVFVLDDCFELYNPLLEDPFWECYGIAILAVLYIVNYKYLS